MSLRQKRLLERGVDLFLLGVGDEVILEREGVRPSETTVTWMSPTL